MASDSNLESEGSSPTEISPTTMPDGSRSTYFSPLNSPRLLDSIPEHHEHHGLNHHHQRHRSEPYSQGYVRPRSRPRLSFQADTPADRSGKPKQGKDRIRNSSPPPEDRFKTKVSFDNFAGGEPTKMNTISFTLNVKHCGYTYKKRSRTFMVGLDENAYSNYALQWMLEEMVDDGDEVVCLRVVDKDAKISSDKSLETKQYKEEARQLMKQIQTENDSLENRAISVVLEFAIGKVHSTFQKMIQLYEPCMLIVGTRGRSLGGFQGLINNRHSFSKWCLQYSPIPVVVVRPTEKREKKKAKRKLDPTRRNYIHILRDSGQYGTHEANATPDESVTDGQLLPGLSSDKEAHEVAALQHLPTQSDLTLISRKVTQTRRKSSENSTGSRSPDSRPSSPGILLKSPPLHNLDSPGGSEDETGGSESEGEFEMIPGHVFLEHEAAEKQLKLHHMEQGEAAALGRRSDSVASLESSVDGDEEGEDEEEGKGDGEDRADGATEDMMGGEEEVKREVEPMEAGERGEEGNND